MVMILQLCEHTKKPVNGTFGKDEFYGICILSQFFKTQSTYIITQIMRTSEIEIG